MILQIISLIFSVLCLALVVVLMVKSNKSQGGTNNVEYIKKLEQKIDENSKLQSQFSQERNAMLMQSVNQNITQTTTLLQEQLKEIRTTLENNLTKIREDNEKKLEQMRQTVDEKLNENLENRLAQSFNIINNRLQSVYEGIGEMKQLATSVGDLKKVLTNVKTRGTWGEIQLGNLLEQILTKEQYMSQVNINPRNMDRVDFAIKMPGKDDSGEVLLPIDAKFPIEDYQRLIEASEKGGKEEVDLAVKGLEKRIKEEAKTICEKYILIPKTTDFAIMYLSIEGLYAEVLRIPGLCETLQQQYKVVVCGPTTIAALLNSLQLGFRTLTIEKRSSEVWTLLGTFKNEFSKFAILLTKTQKKINELSNTIESASKKTKTIERKLRNVTTVEGDIDFDAIEEEDRILLEEGDEDDE